MPQTFNVNDRVKEISSNKEGTVTRVLVLNIQYSFRVTFDDANYPSVGNNKKAYFGDATDDVVAI